MKARHARQNGMHIQAQEGQSESDKANSWRKSDRVPRRCQYTYGRHDDSKNAPQQVHINKRSAILHHQLKSFYLNTPMERPEFMRLKITDLPPAFVALYNLNNITDQNGTVYMSIQKGMYGLPQARILAQQL